MFKKLFIGLVFFIFSNPFYILFSHDQDVHKYITWQAWQLVKYYHPEVAYSIMESHLGSWTDGALNGSAQWQTQKIITAAYREDEEDIPKRFVFC